MQTGKFVATDAPGSLRGSCPKKGIRYLPKGGGKAASDVEGEEL